MPACRRGLNAGQWAAQIFLNVAKVQRVAKGGPLRARLCEHPLRYTTPAPALEGPDHVVATVAFEGVDLQPQNAPTVVAAVLHPAARCVALKEGVAARCRRQAEGQAGPCRVCLRLPAEVQAAAISSQQWPRGS